MISGLGFCKFFRLRRKRSTSSSTKKVTLMCSDGEQFVVDAWVILLHSQTIKHLVDVIGFDSVIPIPNVKSNIMTMVIDFCNKRAQAKAAIAAAEDRAKFQAAIPAAKAKAKAEVRDRARSKDKAKAEGKSEPKRKRPRAKPEPKTVDAINPEVKSVMENPWSWEAEFMKVVEDKNLLGLMFAADYLSIEVLLDLSCQAIADKIVMGTPEQAPKLLKLDNDWEK
ncbi:SKP1-like protein 1 [Humulus lupulus]|uniref:SKP1-like protein 1 n=1 Tax=Humulus lupulus TaxID=3486 RepID=UPI002B4030DF|nr:SKP1-like protein 1 [Humulus lupulus]